MWYSWTTKTAFDVWNDLVVANLNLPRVGINQATGEPQPTKTQTVAYTSVIEVASDDWRAMVEQHIAERFADGLGALSSAPPILEVMA